MSKPTNTKIFFLLTVVFCLSLVRRGSAQTFVDSIAHYVRHGKQSPDFSLGGNNGILMGRRVPTMGVRMGIDFAGRFRVGLGYMGFRFLGLGDGLDTGNPYDIIYPGYSRKLYLWYVCAYAEYLFHKTPRWEFSICTQLGAGEAYYLLHSGTDKKRAGGGTLFLYEPTIKAEYNLLKWVGVGADMGFRFALFKPAMVSQGLSSPMYSFHVDIYWFTLARTLFPENKWVKKL